MKKTILTALIILSITMPLLTVTAQGPPNTPNKPPIPETPGMANAHQINRTDMVPHNFRHNFSAGTPQRLHFRNMVMEINATRNMTMNITSQERVRIQYMSLNINIERNMHLDVHANASPPVDIPAPNVGINKYMNFESNTTEPMNVTLSFYLNQTEIEQELGHEFNKSRASWAYWNGTHWELVKSRINETGLLNANTTHFSTWTIVEQEPPRQMEPPELPGIIGDVQAFNYSDMVPTGFISRIKENQGTMIQFSNTAMYLNSTKTMELDITADSQYTQKTLMLEVNPAESVSLKMDLKVSSPSGVEIPAKTLDMYIDIEPNTTITDAKLGLELDPQKVQNKGLDIAKLEWAFWNGTGWMPVESTLTENNVLEANTDHFSTWTIQEQVPSRQMTPPEIPGISGRVQAFNYRDMTPTGFQHSVKENQGTMLQFKNTAMYLNSTKPMELEVSTENQYTQKTLRLEVDPGQSIRLQINLRVSTPDGVDVPEKHLGVYYEMAPNSTINDAKIGLELDPEEIKNKGLDIAKLEWVFWNGTGWMPVESTLTENNILESNTDHFSTWTIQETVETTEPDTKPSFIERIPIPASFIAIGLAGAALLSKKREQA